MPIEQGILLVVVGVVAGVMSGMFGIGGGVIIVPALVAFLGFTPLDAIATSLAALLLPVGLLAVAAYWRAGLMRPRSSALIAVGLFATVLLGAQIAISLPADLLRQVYGVFLLYMGWRFAEPRKSLAAWRAGRAAAANGTKPPATTEGPVEEPNIHWAVILTVGLVAGVASGLFGIGGGAVIVPALVGILKYDQKLAVGTSLGALLLPVGLPGVVAYYQAGVFDPAVAALVALGLLFGALAGARIAIGLPSKTVKQMYGYFLLFVSLRFIFG